MANSLKCISLNCRGLNSYEKRTKLYDWIFDNDIDIVCLQETHYIEPNAFKYNARWRGLAFHSFSDSPHSRGVSILFRDKLSIELINEYKSIDGRRIMVNFKHKNEIYSIVNVYVPNSEHTRIDFFKRLKTWITQHSPNDGNLILLGDFNCTSSSQDRYTQSNNIHVDRSSRFLQELIEYLYVCDVWREINGNKAKEKYRGVFEIQKSGDKTSSGEIGLDIRTHASPKVGQDQVSGGVSVPCRHATPVADALWKPIFSNNDKAGFTWCDGENIPKSRIDFVFISNNFDMKLDKMCTRKPPSVNKTRLSDHLAIRFNFTVNDFVRGSNYWKLNTSLVTDTGYCNTIRNMLSEHSDELDAIVDKQMRCEQVKLLIKNASILYSKQKSMTVKQKIKHIEKELENIETSDSISIDMNRKRNLENELDTLYESKSKGAYIRSKGQMDGKRREK